MSLLEHLRDPHELFAAWFAEATAAEPDVPDAMQLATSADGAPDLRTVLLKSHGAEGWVFYTNLGSAKSRQINENPRVGALLHWKSLARQVRIAGVVRPLDDATADAYHAARPRGSQLGAWASRQSEPLDHPGTLQHRVSAMEARFADAPVPRPPFWSGYRIDISRFEFWQGRADRLHERVVFEASDGGWARSLLYP